MISRSPAGSWSMPRSAIASALSGCARPRSSSTQVICSIKNISRPSGRTGSATAATTRRCWPGRRRKSWHRSNWVSDDRISGRAGNGGIHWCRPRSRVADRRAAVPRMPHRTRGQTMRTPPPDRFISAGPTPRSAFSPACAWRAAGKVNANRAGYLYKVTAILDVLFEIRAVECHC